MSAMKNKARGNFGSKIGVVLASAGSAVGLGNIWRFPYEAGQNGGAAFLLLYLGCVFLLGLPVMLSEFLIGRRAQANTMRAYMKLAPGTRWHWIGAMGVFAGCFILSYYGVVAAWTLEYVWNALCGRMHGLVSDQYVEAFNAFVASPIRPLVWLSLFMLMTHFVIVKGVRNGIERASKIMMPLLFIIMLILVVRSLTLDGAEKGLRFLFHLDYEKINTSVVFNALGQAFFSLSLGMGCLCTYASYFDRNTNLVRTGVQVTLLDTFVAILAGTIIFPAAFAFGISPEAGPKLVFVILPNVFQQMPGAYFWSLLFYILLTVAAWTSTISLHEVVTAFIHEELKFTRKRAAMLVTSVCFFFGIFCSLSFGVLSEFTLFGLSIFDLFDYISSKLLLPLGGMLISIFTGWYMDKHILWEELSNHDQIRFRLFKVYYFLIRYVTPPLIAFIFLREIGLVRF